MSVLGIAERGVVCFVVCVVVLCCFVGLIDLHRILRALGLGKRFEGDVGFGVEDGHCESRASSEGRVNHVPAVSGRDGSGS